ncbi:MAG: methyltransferase domain-containing protein [Pyrinomonadaceae bacterium]|nr:methyltransferase domain-containing protein [Pyrinomonadaceae bacterium]
MSNFALKSGLKKVRSAATSWIAEPSMHQLEAIRRHELDVVLLLLPDSGRVLEIGAGAGWQAKYLANRGYIVSAIDLPTSTYLENRIWPVINYDGSKIPFDDNTFDVIFSSNVLEHIPNVYAFQEEIHRVLKQDGRVIHVLPSSGWRFWTNITHLIKRWNVPQAHGEHAKNPFTEMFYFSRRYWTRLFRETGWAVEACYSNKLFYTGQKIMGSRLSINTRRKLSRLLGGACNIFTLREKNRHL